MLDGLTIVGDVLVLVLAGYGVYNLYLLYQAKKDEEKNSK